jgi:hypothetical protein
MAGENGMLSYINGEKLPGVSRRFGECDGKAGDDGTSSGESFCSKVPLGPENVSEDGAEDEPGSPPLERTGDARLNSSTSG